MYSIPFHPLYCCFVFLNYVWLCCWARTHSLTHTPNTLTFQTLASSQAMQMYTIVVIGYFLVTAGIIYDVIIEPPAMGQRVDERGRVR